MAFQYKDGQNYTVDDLVEIIAKLRSPGGCPWDAEQTHESIKKNLIEETYEVIEAINKADSDMLREELGDLLMQVVFHVRLESEKGGFGLDDVADTVCRKLIERHPHVFADTQVSGVGDVLANWDAIKRRSKGHDNRSDAMLGVPRELPALMRSAKIQQKAASAGFDWPDIVGALEKLEEEIGELKQALASGDEAACREELGDILFSAVNVSRFAGCEPEEALTEASDKFIARFMKLEHKKRQKGLSMESMSIEELDSFWHIAKSEKA